MQALLDELARDLAPLTGRADLEQAVGLVEAATTSLATATSWLLDASPHDVLAASTPYLALPSLPVPGALIAPPFRLPAHRPPPAQASVHTPPSPFQPPPRAPP